MYEVIAYERNNLYMDDNRVLLSAASVEVTITEKMSLEPSVHSSPRLMLVSPQTCWITSYARPFQGLSHITQFLHLFEYSICVDLRMAHSTGEKTEPWYRSASNRCSVLADAMIVIAINPWEFFSYYIANESFRKQSTIIFYSQLRHLSATKSDLPVFILR